MTTAFQSVFDLAESISMVRTRNVAQTISRDGIVRSTSLGGQIWEFEVKLPDGMPWTTMRPLIEKMEALDRVSTGTVSISKTGHSWITGYQGNFANTGTITASFSSTNQLNEISLVSHPSLVTGYKFRAGDLIQLGSSGKVYSVTDDVLWNNNTVTLHRPVRDNTGTYTLRVGQAVQWTVLCTQFPQWTIVARNQVSWSAPFRFVEVLV